MWKYLIVPLLMFLFYGCAKPERIVGDMERKYLCEIYEFDLPSVDDTEPTAHVMTRNRLRLETFCKTIGETP